jgi:protein TonB
MSTLALRLPSPPRLSWPRVGAISGTLSLHIYAVLLLLTPPVAYQMLKPAEPQTVTTVTLIDTTPPKVEPEPIKDLLPPTHKEKPRPAPHHETVAHVDQPPLTTDPGPMSYPATPDTGASDIAPPHDVAPSALGYGTRTQVKYPREALARREQGTVILRVLVGMDGNPQQVEIEKSSGSPRLDSAAREAVRHWTFRPGTRNGVAQSAWARVPIAFDINQL